MTDARRSDGDISFNCTCCRTQQPQNRLDQSSLTPSQASRRANCQSTRQYRFRTVVIQDRTVSLRMPSPGAVSPLGARHASMTPQRFAADVRHIDAFTRGCPHLASMRPQRFAAEIGRLWNPLRARLRRARCERCADRADLQHRQAASLHTWLS